MLPFDIENTIELPSGSGGSSNGNTTTVSHSTKYSTTNMNDDDDDDDIEEVAAAAAGNDDNDTDRIRLLSDDGIKLNKNTTTTSSSNKTKSGSGKKAFAISSSFLLVMVCMMMSMMIIGGILQYKNYSTSSTNLEPISIIHDNENKNNNNNNDDDSNETATTTSHQMLQILRQRFFHTSKQLLMTQTTSTSTSSSSSSSSLSTSMLQLVPQQFIHLHHMKTGGTSIDTLIRCSIDRLRQLQFTFTNTTTGSTATNENENNHNNNNNAAVATAASDDITPTTLLRLNVPHTTIHECSESYYKTCTNPIQSNSVNPTQERCIRSVATAAVLSYCAPLKDLINPFQWKNIFQSKNYTTTTTPLTTTTTKVVVGVPSQPADNNNNNNNNSNENNHPFGGGLPIHAITILRHPVARVWSMYRFQTKACYYCRTLLQIYEQMDAEQQQQPPQQLPTIVDPNPNNINNSTVVVVPTPPLPPIRTMCQSQLINHQTRNLLSSVLADNGSHTNNNEVAFAYNYTNEQIQDAIYNMKYTFTMIGLTEDMNSTARMVGMVFPWLAEDLLKSVSSSSKASSKGQHKQQPPSSSTTNGWDRIFGIVPTSEEGDMTTTNKKLQVQTTGDFKKCPIRHENASPKNNRCGPNNAHLPLPNEPPDDATVQAILAHNVADMALYNAAVQQFALQKQVLL